ncbi:MAG: ferritin-like domain-containing protein, partial [Bdellovibrionota bacterium]
MKISQAKPFVSDLQEIRRRAREHIKRGAITPSYRGDRQTAIKILNEALATEIVCVLRYNYHFFAAQGIQSESVKQEFREHALEEQRHADMIAKRIIELGGKPEMNPGNLLALSHSEYQEGETLVEMIEEDLIAERIAIDSYRDMIHYFAEIDATSRRMLEEILAKEEEHAEDLASLLLAMDPTKKAD